MALCLYECLCEAELEKYYPQFVAFGLQKIDELAKIAMKDYARLGVHNMNDRKRLFQLIRIIKIMQEEEDRVNTTKQGFQPRDFFVQPQVTRSGPRRQLHFESFFEKKDETVKHCELDLHGFSDFCTLEERESLVEMLGHVIPADSEDSKITRRDMPNNPGTHAQNELHCATIYSSNNIAPLLGDSEAPIIQRVTHISGYNYGLPHSCISTRLLESCTPKDKSFWTSRQKFNSQRRSNTLEKEVPWTETDKIRVCVRKRPLGPREERRGEVNIITVEDKETLLLHEKKEAVDLTQYILQHVFYFDEVFGEACSNHDVYLKTAHPLIQHIFNGGNATCFAYGQTGAGKTYTMIGTHQNPGLYALAAKDIFRQLEASQSRQELHVWISFYEIYCGQLYDLLNGRRRNKRKQRDKSELRTLFAYALSHDEYDKPVSCGSVTLAFHFSLARLFAREDSKHVVQIVGLREVQVATVDLLLEVILKGGKERSTGATGVNSDSSRSHAIIQIQIKDTANRMFGRISFIDLAGSERAADARDSDKQTKLEGAEINQSLLALKECIRALDQEHAHTPFRQSKLTQVLKDSFIGNSKTCMIANVSPSHIATEHTLNTLRYADRVKELKKGIKCCTPITNRRRTAGNGSPKRNQNSPSMQVGEKSSPKKVKLGLQHPLSSLKIKASPSAFHPTSVPFSSTPKGVKSHAHKGNASSPWLNHTSPIKGMLKIGHPMKKKTGDLTLPSEKHHTAKDFVITTAASPETRENGQGDNCIQDKQFVRCPKVQTVQPVQKQLISRDGFSSGDVSHPSDSSQHCGSVFAKQCTEVWASLPPHQKEREQHLRLYHQQFQQPPLLQKRLNYQPLERFLAQYKPQEIRVKQDQSLPPADSQCKEGMLLEDLDDSDFSEDSFSPVANRRKVKRSTTESSQLSFFLHQRGQGSEEERGRERQGLFFEHAAHAQEEHELNDNWDCGKGSAFPGSIIDGESHKIQSGWSTEDDLTDSPETNNNAEEPYCLQDDLICSRKNSKDLPADHKQSKSSYLAYPGENTSFPKKETQSSHVPHVLDSQNPECNKISLPHAQREEYIKDERAPVAGIVEGKNLKNGTSHGASNTSSEFPSELMAPLTMSLLDSNMAADSENIFSDQEEPLQVKQMLERKTYSSRKRVEEEARQFLRDKASPTASMPELGEQIYHCEKKSILQLSPQTENKWLSQSCCDAKPWCSLVRSSPWNAHQSSSNDLFVRDEDLMEATASVRARNPGGENEDELFLSNLTCREYVDNSRQYDADTENTTGSLLSTPENSSVGKGPNIWPFPQAVHAVMPEKGYFSCAPLGLSPGRVECTASSVSSRESSLLQPRSEFGSKDASHSEGTFKLSFSGQEIGLLKNKLMQSIFTQDNSDAAEQDSGSATKEIRSSTNQTTPNVSIIRAEISTSETSNWHTDALGKAQQVLIQAHREQLNEMASLCLKEETLINQVSATDFGNFVTKLDEILVLKSKCLESMRAQLQLYLACPGTDATLQRTTSP